MPHSAFSRAPSRIFYTLLFYKFCVLADRENCYFVCSRYEDEERRILLNHISKFKYCPYFQYVAILILTDAPGRNPAGTFTFQYVTILIIFDKNNSECYNTLHSNMSLF